MSMKFEIEIAHPDKDVMLTVAGDYFPGRQADMKQPGEPSTIDINTVKDEAGADIPEAEIDRLFDTDWYDAVMDRAEVSLWEAQAEYEACRAEYEYDSRREDALLGDGQ